MLETHNIFMVGVTGHGALILRPKIDRIYTKDEVLNLCAWLLLVSNQEPEQVASLMKEIEKND